MDRFLWPIPDATVFCAEKLDNAAADRGDVTVYDVQHFTRRVDFDIDFEVELVAVCSPFRKLVVHHQRRVGAVVDEDGAAVTGVGNLVGPMYHIISRPGRIRRRLFFIGVGIRVPDVDSRTLFHEFQGWRPRQLVRRHRPDADKSHTGITKIVVNDAADTSPPDAGTGTSRGGRIAAGNDFNADVVLTRFKIIDTVLFPDSRRLTAGNLRICRKLFPIAGTFFGILRLNSDIRFVETAFIVRVVQAVRALHVDDEALGRRSRDKVGTPFIVEDFIAEGLCTDGIIKVRDNVLRVGTFARIQLDALVVFNRIVV